MNSNLALWPLVVALEDCYIPDSAAALIEGLHGLDDEALSTSIPLWAMDAELETSVN